MIYIIGYPFLMKTKEHIIIEAEGDKDNLPEESYIPSMNVTVDQSQNKPEEKVIISDKELVDFYQEIAKEVRKDKEEIDLVLANFINMVVNDGDSNSSTKEALVNLLKLKADQSDKLTKVADLMTRIKLKDKDTFPKYLAANQNNTINIGSDNKRALLEALQKAKHEQK